MDFFELLTDAEAAAKEKRLAGTAKSTTEYRIRQCRDSLALFVGADTLDPVHVISTGWIDRFTTFLLTGDDTRKPLSDITAIERRKRLKTCCRDAIQRGWLPNITVFPAPGAPLGREIERFHDPDRLSDLRRLLSLYPLRLTSPEAAERHDARVIALTALSVLLAGIGIPDLLTIISEEITDGTIYLPHLHTQVALPSELHTLLTTLSHIGIAPDVAERESAELLKTLSLAFPEGFEAPFTQWLELAGGAGLSRADRMRLIDMRCGVIPADRAFIENALRAVIDHVGTLSPHWHCIKCIGSMHVREGRRHLTRAVSGSLLRDNILAAGLPQVDSVDFYPPFDPVVTDRKGKKEVKNNRLLDALLFFRADRQQADAINRHLLGTRHGVIFHRRTPDALEYAVISDADIRRLRSFLAVKDSKRFVLDDFKDLKGTRVRVTTGIYAGYEGEVCDIAGSGPGACFLIRIQGICAVATYAVDPAYLEKAEASPSAF